MGQGGQGARCSALAVTGWQGEKAVIRYGSVCSGIEAATVAWHGLGWEAAWYSEIEPFPSAVLAHHYPTVPNYGDMTKFEEWPDEPINLLVGGTPCQSFSVAGLRKGLADPRGNLMLTYGAIARRYRPEWLVWENVPGVLSSNGGRDFGTFLGMLAELGYGFAYRVLDAQYFGVAQRRRRVFVVGHLGSWQRATAVLFESYSLQGHPAPSREQGKDVAGTIAARFGSSRNNIEEVAPPQTAFTTSSIAEYREGVGTLRANGGDLGGGSETLIANTLTAGIGRRYDGETDTFALAFPWQSALDPIGQPDNISGTLIKNQTMAVAAYPMHGGMIGRQEQNGPSGSGFGDADDPSYTLTAGGQVRHGVAVTQPIPIDTMNHLGRGDHHSFGDFQPGGPSYTLTKGHSHAVAQPVASDQTAGTLRANLGSGWRSNGTPVEGVAIQAMQVRRLTPVECERLQGFPDGYTNIPWRKAAESPDGPRYKALGNSMAVPVMAWIGKRIQQVSEL
jgi:DNA (cytosine-5)-methyltransferase 1